MSSSNHVVGDKISLKSRLFKFPLLGVLILLHKDGLTLSLFATSILVSKVCCSTIWANPSYFGIVRLVFVIHACRGLLTAMQIAVSSLTTSIVVSSDMDGFFGF